MKRQSFVAFLNIPACIQIESRKQFALPHSQMVTSRPRILQCYLSPSSYPYWKVPDGIEYFFFFFLIILDFIISGLFFLCIGIWFSLYWLVLICIHSLLSGFYPIIWIETLLLYFSSTVTPIFFLYLSEEISHLMPILLIYSTQLYMWDNSQWFVSEYT